MSTKTALKTNPAKPFMIERLYNALKELETDSAFDNDEYSKLLEEYEQLYGKNTTRDSN